VRLGSCVAVELALGASIAAAVGGIAFWTVRDLRGEWGANAHAASLSTVEVEVDVESTPKAVAVASLATSAPESASDGPAQVIESPPQPRDSAPLSAPVTGTFLGKADEVLLAPLRTQAVSSVKVNHGGTSVSLRIEFADGSRAAFKPRQIHAHSNPRREIAAYRINRLIGLSSVPPAIGRAFAKEDIFGKLREPSSLPRLHAEMLLDGPEVHGELSWWIPVLGKPRIAGVRVDEPGGMAAWKSYLTQATQIPAESVAMLAQISTLVLWDYLINNPDRWSGGNVNSTEDGSFVYFMDNTFSFGDELAGHFRPRGILNKVERFSRSLVARLRTLTEDEVRGAVAHDLGPFEYLLSDREIAGVIYRRDQAINHVDQLIAQYGEAAVLVFP
jgi:hypothetical protein